MGDRAITVLYTKDPIQSNLLHAVRERLCNDSTDLITALVGLGLLAFKSKGSYPAFVLEDLYALENVPDPTVAISINDSGDVRYYRFEKGGWAGCWTEYIVPKDCMYDEDLYNKWLEQARTITQKDEEIRRLKYEISVLKGKL